MRQTSGEGRIRLHLTARFESDVRLASGSLGALERLVDAFLGPERAPAFSLACHEGVMNAIIHAHGEDASRMVVVELIVREGEIEARIVDEEGSAEVAARYNTALTNPYDNKNLADLPESGVGSWLVQQGADVVRYEAGPVGGRLILVSSLTSQPKV